MVEAAVVAVFVVLVGVIYWARKPDPRRRSSQRQRERAREAYRRDIDADQ